MALSLFVVTYSVWYSNSRSVVIRNVVRASVIFAAKVSMIIWLKPWMVVEMLTLVVRVAVSVRRDVCQTSYCLMHSSVPLGYRAHTFNSTSSGDRPSVMDCHGAR